jgi:type IV pilus assembly protein PilM
MGKSAPSAVVGLDIGSELIKVAEAKLAKDGIRITGLGIAPTPVGSVDNNIVVDPQALGNAIKALLRDSGIKTKTVVSSVSGQSSVVVRVIDVPRMNNDELAETMKWEVERHVPFSPTEIVMDFAPIEKPGVDPNAQSMEVLLAVAQQGAIDAHVKTLFAAGLAPRAIDVQPLAVSRSLVKSDNAAGPHAVAVINIGATTTEVEVYEDGHLVFPGPPLPIAGINLSRAISESIGVSMDDAEMMKKEYGAADVSIVQQQQPAADDDTGFDFGAPAVPTFGGYDAAPAQADPEPSPANEPTSYDTSVVQSDTDFSPFDFGGAATPPPPVAPAPAPPSFDISGDDVFDLGGGEQQSPGFKPVFDLEDADPTPASQQPAGAGGFNFDFSASTEPQQTVAAGADDSQAQPVPDASASGTGQAPAGSQGSDTAQMVNQAIAPVLIELATEIRRSLDYYATRYQNRPEQIILCGGTAKLRDLDMFLSNELGIPVQVAKPMAFLTVQCPKYTPQYIDEIAALMPVSIGLAIRDMIE